MSSNRNGIDQKKAKLCVQLIRGSPELWDAYKKERVVRRENKLQVNREFINTVVNWMFWTTNSLWKNQAKASRNIDNGLTVEFRQAITETPIWNALQQHTITLEELFMEASKCTKAGRTLTTDEEEALAGELLLELSL